MMHKTETSGDDAAEEWSIQINWKEDSANLPSRLNGEGFEHSMVKTGANFQRFVVVSQKANSSWESNLSKILPVNCKFIRCSTSS